VIEPEDLEIPPYLARTLVRLAMWGEKNEDLARSLGRTYRTTIQYVRLLMEMTDTPTRAALVAWAWRSGFMDMRPHELRQLHSDVLTVAGAA
jgi:DNA-binding CsgD family transcriptional regulator